MSPQATKSPKRKIEWFRPFGRTGLRTSCLAIGGGMMISSIDMLYWGWMDTGDGPSLAKILANRGGWVGRGSIAHRSLEQLFGATERMKKHGVLGHIGASFHDLELARTFAQDPGLDGAMVRFNVTHRRAATEFFPSLPPRKKRPGVMTFNTMSSQAASRRQRKA